MKNNRSLYQKNLKFKKTVAHNKAKSFKETCLKLSKYLVKYKLALSFVLLCAFLSTVFSILGPKILGTVTTKLLEGVMSITTGLDQGIDFKYIGGVILFLFVLYVFSFLFSYLQNRLLANISMKVIYQLRKDIFEKIQKIPFKYYDLTSYGEILSYLTNDVDSISQNLNQSIIQIITSVTTLIGITTMMLFINLWMTLVIFCVLPISYFAVKAIVKKSHKYFFDQQKYLGKINGFVEEMYGNHMVVKIFNGEEINGKKFKKYNNQLYTSAWKSQFLSGIMTPLIFFIGNLAYAGVCILGGYLAVTGQISIGDMQAFIQYVGQFNTPITQVANMSNILQETMAATERIFNFLEVEEEVPESQQAIHVNHDSKTTDTELCVTIEGSIQFVRVNFSYMPKKPVIHDFSASILPGQNVAIVGPTGAGKTTLVKLLIRFYDVTEGAILIDGYDIREFTRKDLRSLFGMVLQDAWLYNASIVDNIRYGKQTASEEEVVLAAKMAQIDSFINSLPEGYNTMLHEEASNISQGQKQLITIARALLTDPQILILDEATSSVDTRTEILIQKAMGHLMKGRTSFIIAHRLSTIRNANVIMVLKDGDIVEQGDHKSLLKANGFYTKLYHNQFV